MHNHFSILSIQSDFSNKNIIIETSFNIKKDTVNKNNVMIVEASSGTQSIYKLTVEENLIIATFKDWPDINTEYQVNLANIRDMLNRELYIEVSKMIKFNIDVREKAEVISPLNNEVVLQENNLIYIAAKVIDAYGNEFINNDPKLIDLFNSNSNTKNESKTYSCEFQIALDVAFFDMNQTFISEQYTDAVIQIDNGQYFIRVRIIDGENKGEWSNPISFNVIPKSNENNELSDLDSDYLKDVLSDVDFFLEKNNFEILSMSKNGECINEFYIEFNKEINKEKLPKTISVFRRNL